MFEFNHILSKVDYKESLPYPAQHSLYPASNLLAEHTINDRGLFPQTLRDVAPLSISDEDHILLARLFNLGLPAIANGVILSLHGHIHHWWITNDRQVPRIESCNRLYLVHDISSHRLIHLLLGTCLNYAVVIRDSD